MIVRVTTPTPPPSVAVVIGLRSSLFNTTWTTAACVINGNIISHVIKVTLTPIARPEAPARKTLKHHQGEERYSRTHSSRTEASLTIHGRSTAACSPQRSESSQPNGKRHLFNLTQCSGFVVVRLSTATVHRAPDPSCHWGRRFEYYSTTNTRSGTAESNAATGGPD